MPTVTTMLKTFLLLSQLLVLASCRMKYLTETSLICEQTVQMGKAECCCSGCGETTWGQFCNGDLSGNQGCASNQIIGSITGGQTLKSGPITTGPLCYRPGRCYLETWRYVYGCCSCPPGYKVYTGGSSKPNCNRGALCVGCTDPKEILVGKDDREGYKCTCAFGSSTGSCKPASDNCTFYSCLEDEYKCGPTDYPIAYGLKYCEKFGTASSKFSPLGQTWIRNVRLCLQKALVSEARCKSNCSMIRADAIASHIECYISNGVCDLATSDWLEIVKVVGIDMLLPVKEAILSALKTAVNGLNLLQFVTDLFQDQNE